jgi:hypothetical protein
MYRKLYAEGIRFVQVEPFLERLLEIHGKFADGHSPGAIENNPVLLPVYAAEKRATRDLVDYYAAAADRSFETVLSTLKRFARSDAERFRLRDNLRAFALSDHVLQTQSIYVEAGTMHVWLRKQLRWLYSKVHRIHCLHLMKEESRTLTGRGVLLGPGDMLTWIYLFKPHARSERCDRLAAQSLIYNKVITKHELSAESETFAHLRDEWRAIQTVRRLAISDCASLFPEIRHVGTVEARSRIDAYLKRHRKQIAF